MPSKLVNRLRVSIWFKISYFKENENDTVFEDNRTIDFIFYCQGYRQGH